MIIIHKVTKEEFTNATPVVNLEKLPKQLVIDAGEYQIIFEEKETRQLNRLLG